VKAQVIDLVVTVLTIATITAIVLPNRPSAKLITGFFDVLNGSVRSAEGK